MVLNIPQHLDSSFQLLNINHVRSLPMKGSSRRHHEHPSLIFDLLKIYVCEPIFSSKFQLSKICPILTWPPRNGTHPKFTLIGVQPSIVLITFKILISFIGINIQKRLIQQYSMPKYIIKKKLLGSLYPWLCDMSGLIHEWAHSRILKWEQPM